MKYIHELVNEEKQLVLAEKYTKGKEIVMIRYTIKMER